MPVAVVPPAGAVANVTFGIAPLYDDVLKVLTNDTEPVALPVAVVPLPGAEKLTAGGKVV